MCEYENNGANNLVFIPWTRSVHWTSIVVRLVEKTNVRPFRNMLWKAYTTVISFQLKNASQALFSSLVRCSHSTTGTRQWIWVWVHMKESTLLTLFRCMWCAAIFRYCCCFCSYNWFDIREKSSNSFVRWRGGGVDSTLVNMQLFLNDIDKLFGNRN